MKLAGSTIVCILYCPLSPKYNRQNRTDISQSRCGIDMSAQIRDRLLIRFEKDDIILIHLITTKGEVIQTLDNKLPFV